MFHCGSPEGLHFIKTEVPTQLFSCKYSEILRTAFLIEHLRWLFLVITILYFHIWEDKFMIISHELQKAATRNWAKNCL